MENEDKIIYIKKHIGTQKLFNSFIKENILTRQEKEKLQWAFEELLKTRINTLFIDDAYNIIFQKINPAQTNTKKSIELHNIKKGAKDEGYNSNFYSSNKTLLKYFLITILTLVVINFLVYKNYLNIVKLEKSTEEHVKLSNLTTLDGIYYSLKTKEPFRGEAFIRCVESQYQKQYYIDGELLCVHNICNIDDFGKAIECSETLIEETYNLTLPKKNAIQNLKSTEWLNKIVILIFAIFFILNIRKKKINIQEIILPNHFLLLSSENRKHALDYAWDISTKISNDLPRLKTVKGYLGQRITYALLALVGAISLFSLLSLHSIIFLISIIIFILILYKHSSIKIKNEYQLEIESRERDKRNKLVNLAVSFINENIKIWIKDIEKKHINTFTIEVADNIPEKTYILYSYNIEILANNLMPPTSIYLTHVFIEKYITIISNIVIDIKKTTYSLIDKDEPLYFLNSKNDWNSEEFHYKDIIEIGYKPIGNNVKQVDSIKFENDEDIQRGTLFISLVNSTTKEYPTAKKGIENLFTDIRKRVRLSKT